jgi:serine/threonine-protein kinase
MTITVQLLGCACLRSGDVPLSGPPAQRHRIALLTLIVATWPQPLSRDRSMALLWPERDQASARRLLNLAVHVLRSALGEETIASTGDGLMLNPSRLTCDLHDLRSAVAANEHERVVRLYSGPLLDGFHLDESVEFGYWLDERRNDIHHTFLGALRELAARQERSGDVHGWVRTSRRMVGADPHSGAYALGLMRALEAAGDRAGAIRHATEHGVRVRADLDLEPDADVVALAEQLRVAAPRRQAAPATRVREHSTSVAVLPFVNLGGDAENEDFADGITEDVIAHLSKIRALKVISRSSVMPFKPRQQSFREIGATLGASLLLDGSVRRGGDRVRIVAKLVDAASHRHLWAETYDRQLTDIFAIQTDVALQIAAALEAELTPDERARVSREPTHDVQAYRLFLQGRRWTIAGTAEALMRASEFFDLAIARDPAFALPHAQLAMAFVDLIEMGAVEPTAAEERATRAAANALRLDPDCGEAHCVMGQLRLVREFDWKGAEQSFKRALELTPSSADTHDVYGRLCTSLERYDEALALLLRAEELDPLAHRLDVATTLLRAGRIDEALLRAGEAVELNPSDRALATLGWALFLSGSQADGVAELERAVSASSGNGMWLGQLGAAHGMSGNREKARSILRELEERAGRQYISPYHFAYVHAGLGEAEQAIDYLERAVAARTGPASGIKGSFLFTGLREHPRFRALLRRMNLE